MTTNENKTYTIYGSNDLAYRIIKLLILASHSQMAVVWNCGDNNDDDDDDDDGIAANESAGLANRTICYVLSHIVYNVIIACYKELVRFWLKFALAISHRMIG